MSAYQQTISELAPAGYDPAQIEAFMRVEHGTLDHLSRDRFAEEVRISCMTIDQAGPSLSKAVARSCGFTVTAEESEYRVAIITEPRGATPWFWTGKATSHEEAEFMARRCFEAETLLADYTVAAVCREDELDGEVE